MDDDTHDTSDTGAAIAAPLGCDECTMGVELVDGLIRACANCSHTSRGHRTDREAAGLVFEALAALADLRELLWPTCDANVSWSPDTIDEIARRLEFLRTSPNYPGVALPELLEDGGERTTKFGASSETVFRLNLDDPRATPQDDRAIVAWPAGLP
jgi:hypothetical protein